MRSVHLESAIVGVEIRGVVNAGNTTLIDEFGSLGATYVELGICVSLPVTKEQRVSIKESIHDISVGGDGIGIAISVEAALELLGGCNEFDPGLIIIAVLKL